MVAKILDYTPDADDRTVDVLLGFFSDAGAQIETDTIVVPADKFTADFVIDRIRGILDVKVHQDDPMPTKAQLEGILPIGFKVTVPG